MWAPSHALRRRKSRHFPEKAAAKGIRRHSYVPRRRIMATNCVPPPPPAVLYKPCNFYNSSCRQFFLRPTLLLRSEPAVISRPRLFCCCSASSYFPATILLQLPLPAVISRLRFFCHCLCRQLFPVRGLRGGSVQRPSSPPAENNCRTAVPFSTAG